jgi:hypothetical protein
MRILLSGQTWDDRGRRYLGADGLSEEGNGGLWIDQLLGKTTVAVDDGTRAIRDVAAHIIPGEMYLTTIFRRKVCEGGVREQGVMGMSSPEPHVTSNLLACDWHEGIHSFPRDTWDGQCLYFWLDAAFYDPKPSLALPPIPVKRTTDDMQRRIDAACEALQTRLAVRHLDRYLFVPPIDFRGPTRCGAVILTIDRKSLLHACEGGTDLFARLINVLKRERQEALDEQLMLSRAAALDRRQTDELRRE